MIRPSRAAFAFIFITVTLDMLALGIIAPVLPKLIVTFEGGDVAHAARIVGLFGFGIAMMIAPLMLSQIFAVAIRSGGRAYAGAPFAFTAFVLLIALLLAARATRLSTI